MSIVMAWGYCDGIVLVKRGDSTIKCHCVIARKVRPHELPRLNELGRIFTSSNNVI